MCLISYRIFIINIRSSFSATKVYLNSTDNSSDILGISAMIINDLKRKRQRDYTFDWNTIFDVSL